MRAPKFVEDHMVIDPALRREVVSRIAAGQFGDAPDRAVHDLGGIALPDGRTVMLYLRHAADPIIIDDLQQVVLVTRLHSPGAGLLSLPGGFIDATGTGVEKPLATAIREAVEETGIGAGLLLAADGKPVGTRSYDRPFDIREVWSDIAGTAIRKGDLMAVSTQGFCFRLKGNLLDIPLKAGDDAGEVHIMKISNLKPEQLAVPDHLGMIRGCAG